MPTDPVPAPAAPLATVPPPAAALSDGAAAQSAMLDAAQRLYAALQQGDTDTLRALLAEDFQGHLTPGLPNGFGRTYAGREAMLRDGWGAVGQLFAMAPEPDELLECGDVVVGRGHYVGTALPTGKPVRARFAHFWRFAGGHIVSVHQVTDSAAWHAALQP